MVGLVTSEALTRIVVPGPVAEEEEGGEEGHADVLEARKDP